MEGRAPGIHEPTSLVGSDLIAASVIVCIWGTSFVAMKMALQTFTPFQLGAARFVLGVLPLILVVRPPGVRWKWMLLYGLFQGVGQFSLLYSSLRVGMTTSLASVLMQTQMFFTALLSLLLLSERPGRHLLFGMGFAAVGLGCFVASYLAPGGASGETTVAGFVLCLGAAAMWGASNIIVRLAQQESPEFDVLGFLVWCSTVPILPFLALSYALDSSHERLLWTETDWKGWLAVAYIGWAGTLFSYSVWTKLLKRHGANQVAPFSLGVPIVGLASGTIFLGERLSAWQWAGIAVTLMALAWVILGARKAPVSRRPAPHRDP